MLVFQAEVEKNTQHIYGLRIELASRLKKLEKKKGGRKELCCAKKFLQYTFWYPIQWLSNKLDNDEKWKPFSLSAIFLLKITCLVEKQR